MMRQRIAIFPVGVILISYVAAVLLGSSLKSYFIVQEQGQDVIQKMFGGLRALVGDWAFIKGEEYYHRGLPFMKAMAYHHGESVLAGRMEHLGEESGHDHQHEDRESKKDLFSKIYASVKVTGDSHLTPSEEKEVLPWFYVEVRFNPHDIRGYSIGGYWLQEFGRPEEALKFLKEGERNNPNSASIQMSLAWYYYTTRDFNSAIEYLEKARKLWLDDKEPNHIINEYMRSDRFFTFILLADIYKNIGQPMDALDTYIDLYYIDPSQNVMEKAMQLTKHESGA